MYLPCLAFIAFSTRHVPQANPLVLETKFSANQAINYSPWTNNLLKKNYSPLSAGDKQINLTLNKEFSLHAFHHGETFLVSTRYTF